MTILSRLPQVRGSYRENADLSKMCWFGVGGIANVFYKPQDAEDLSFFLKNKPKDIPHFVLGVGSNILISDSGFKGVVIRLGREFNYVKFEGDEVIAGAATLDLNVAIASADNGYAGLEFLSGIPGTIGGALQMNAGAYGSEVKDILISAKAIDEDGNIIELKNHDFGFKYRGHNLNNPFIFTEATFQSNRGNAEEIKLKLNEIQEKRASTQPIRSKTGGSTFKNPDGIKAWELIDKAGCRGLKVGGAQVSEKHCNFFINTGDATAQDLEDLMNLVKKRVFETSGIMLHEEIKVIK